MAIDISDNDIEIDEPSRLQPTATYNVKITTPETELLRAENERYRRALEWYANASDYELADSQIRARWALEGKEWDTPAPANESENAR